MDEMYQLWELAMLRNSITAVLMDFLDCMSEVCSPVPLFRLTIAALSARVTNTLHRVLVHWALHSLVFSVPYVEGLGTFGSNDNVKATRKVLLYYVSSCFLPAGVLFFP